MGFLAHFTATDEHGKRLQEETVVADLDALSALEKVVIVHGKRITLRFVFDPPLVASVAPEPEDAREDVTA